MKIGDIFIEEREDSSKHLMRCVEDDTGQVSGLIKDLGILDDKGCLPCPWDDKQYPRLKLWNSHVWIVSGTYGALHMYATGMTREEAIARWNQRSR